MPRDIIHAALLGLAAGWATSVGAETGKVTSLYTRDPDGLQLAEISTRATERATCATQGYMVIRDEKTDTGKAQYAMLMAAYLADRTVTITGSGACTRWRDGEDIAIVRYP
jgi:hypothetical protein